MAEQKDIALTRELLDFLDSSPSSFHAVDHMAMELTAAGFVRLREGSSWKIRRGGSYYVTRNGSALIAFRVPDTDIAGFQIMASHSDSPTFKIKTNAELETDHKYIKLNVEKYGGMLCAPWMDRPLSVAGRVVVRTETGIESRLIAVDRDLLMVPNLAIHMNRNVNDGYTFNVQKDMLPLLGGASAKGGFLSLIAAEAGVAEADILDTDLFLYNRTKGTIYGLNQEYVASARLDDLQCAFASLKGFLAATPNRSVAVHCVLDNEEVGSGTRQGAASTFLKDTLKRIVMALGGIGEDYRMMLASSFMVSADNAHSVHPNQADKADPTNRPYMNEGIVIKYSANQKYTTDAISGALFRTICERAGVPCQTFANRSDMLGGSTLGNISSTQVPLITVDIGLPQLAMHSSYETAGIKDTGYLVEAAKVLFSTSLAEDENGNYQLY